MRQIKYTIGIDPGKLGAIALMDIQNQKILKVFDTPIIKGEKSSKDDRYDLHAMWNILHSYMADPSPYGAAQDRLAVLEHAVAMPGQSSSTVMKAGYGYGIWEAMLVAAGFNYRIIYPITWSKPLFEGLDGNPTKVNSYEVAKANFPDAEFVLPNSKRKKPMDGRTDAMCIALYAARYIVPTL